MRNEIAEWMLSRAAPPEQAKAMLGDLLEAQPRPVEFWFGVLRAAGSLAIHQPAKRIFTNLFWFSYEAGFYLFLAWLSTAAHRFSWSRIFVLIILSGAIFLGGWLLWAPKKESSVVLQPAFFLWLLAHDGAPWVGAILFLLTVPYGWYMQWRRKQKKVEKDNARLAAG